MKHETTGGGRLMWEWRGGGGSGGEGEGRERVAHHCENVTKCTVAECGEPR